jgi:hypothetical protein
MLISFAISIAVIRGCLAIKLRAAACLVIKAHSGTVQLPRLKII